ncbi:MAG: hypothetical protein AAF409_14925 [Pseudomonadota bacterium]
MAGAVAVAAGSLIAVLVLFRQLDPLGVLIGATPATITVALVVLLVVAV